MSVVGPSVVVMAEQFDHQHRGGDSVPTVIELYPDAGRCGLPALFSGVSPSRVPRRADGAEPVLPTSLARGSGRAAVGTLVDHSRSSESHTERALVGLIRHTQGLDLDERLAQHTTDEHLFSLLTRIDLDQIDDPALVEAAAAADRLEAAAHALKLRAAATLAGRVSMTSAALADHTQGPAGVAGDELTLRLRTSAKAGADLVRRGKALAGHLCATGDALAAGRINAARAQVIVDGLEHVAWEIAAAVEDLVLPRAAHRTPAQLRSDVAKALIAVDATAAEVRARQRAASRRVTRPRAENDQTASMRIEGPAADVLALDLALDATARAAKASGDQRTIDQLRFDSLAGIAHHALTTGHLGDPATGTRLATTNGHLPRIHITMGLDQLLPQSAAGSTDAAGTATGGRRASGTTTTNRDGRSGTAAAAAPQSCACACAGGKAAAGESAAGSESAAAGELSWPPQLPGERLTGEAVPELAGYGPITPATARALAAGGIWSRIVTDPLSGAVLDVGTTRYRPTRAMAEHVVARDRTCVRPGCTHQARACQLDHTYPYDHAQPEAGGRTGVANLGPLCSRDHQTKTHAGFHVTQPEPGIFEWMTPTGHRYRRERDGTTRPLSHKPPPDWADPPPDGDDALPGYGPPPF